MYNFKFSFVALEETKFQTKEFNTDLFVGV